MNDRILIIEHSSSKISERFGYPKLEFSNQSKDQEIHSWLITNKSKFKDLDKLFITSRLGHSDSDFIGIYVGMHIRLTIELEDAHLLPIFFFLNQPKKKFYQVKLIKMLNVQL